MRKFLWSLAILVAFVAYQAEADVNLAIGCPPATAGQTAAQCAGTAWQWVTTIDGALVLRANSASTSDYYDATWRTWGSLAQTDRLWVCPRGGRYYGVVGDHSDGECRCGVSGAVMSARPIQITYQGVTFRSRADLAKWLGIERGTLKTRMRLCWPEERWGWPLLHRIFNGRSLADLAAEAGVHASTIYRRISRGEPPHRSA